ncbi:UbiA family prenyltransferase [Deinococcus peraridilitoris]|uniref:4-hydroxybenzoate polyprenyltransferase-like prenyltransferase n=1 Tax=Deinococcus peraridilitoris (strain DSM 19664 / LMG 22246 / CIP 109416 / KR-200) TaxID=937777 RepID=K9ZYT5_DEIPD|nr:UbiA family prenyltransferase [Deinococcus peraridilitoris]AFZ66813.1 4-hydroxybenzoate polyprenyltransferase-like prenyltransferase [Deinococcus peraridilitoris DSM 19664]
MSSSPVLPSLPRRLRGHLALARISNSPTVVTNVLAGAALGGSLGMSQQGAFVAVAMVLFYTAGMYLNDLLDLEIDRRERPTRPLPSGLIGQAEALGVTLLLFVLGSLLLWTAGTAALVSGLVLIALIVLYDAWHKTNPLSPVLMAGTRMLVYVTAFLAFTAGFTTPLLVWTGLLGAYIVGLTYIAKTETKENLARYWPALLIFLPAVYFVFTGPSLVGWALLLAFVAWAAFSVTFVYDRRKRSIGRAVVSLIAGVSLLDALVLASQGASNLIPLALLAFALTLFLQRFIKGT